MMYIQQYLSRVSGIIVDMVKDGTVANAIDTILRKETFWLENMQGETEATGNWTDWFTKENCEKVMPR